MEDSQYLLKLCENGEYEEAYSMLQKDPLLVQDLSSEYLVGVHASFLNHYPDGVGLLENLVSASGRLDKDDISSIFETEKKLKDALRMRSKSG